MQPKRIFPFKDALADGMQRRVVQVIQSPNFDFNLPELNASSWNTICEDDHERNRLEFLGDALIGSFIAEDLFRRYPDEGPGFYTAARMVLTANSTFAHIMHKIGFHDIQDAVKPAGDAFETILAAYHNERGVVAFNEYAGKSFGPLLESAASAYRDLRSTIRKDRKGKRREKLGATAVLLGNANTRGKGKKQKGKRQKASQYAPKPGSHFMPISKPRLPPAKHPTANRILEVIDLTNLTSDSESDAASDDPEASIEFVDKPNSPIQKVPLPTRMNLPSSPTQSKSKTTIILDSSPPPPEPETARDLQSQDILKSISVSPQVRRTRPTDGHVHDDLSSKFITSLNILQGSADNPITFD